MNKLTKLLSVFVIAGAIGTGILGVAGCKKGGGEAHTHSYTYTNKGATHDGACECGKDPIIGQAHSWGTDGKCTANGCDAVKPAETNVTGVTITAPEKTTIYVGDKITLTATVQAKEGTTVSQEVTWAIVSGGSYATINAATGELTATGLGSVYVVATSVDGEVDSSALTIKIEERNLYAELVADTENNVIGEDFEDATKYENGKLPEYKGYNDSTMTTGLYSGGSIEDGTAASTAFATNYVGIANGKAEHIAPAEKSTNLSFIADLKGEVKDYIEGYVELTPKTQGGVWLVLSFIGTSGASTEVGEAFSICMVDNNGTMGYRIGGKTGTVVSTDVSWSTNDMYKVHYKLDMITGLLTVDMTPNGGSMVNFCTDLQTEITSLRAIASATSNGGLRQLAIDNFAVNSKTATLAEAQSSLKAKIDGYVAKATTATDDGEYTLTLTGTGVTEAINVVKTAIDGAADVAAAKAACVTTSIDTAILEQAKTSAKGILTAYRSDESFTHEGSNKDAMEKAKADGEAAITSASAVDGVRTALKNAIDVAKEVLNDADDSAAKVNITLKLGNDSGEAVGTIVNAVADKAIPLADLIAAVTSDKYLKSVKIYEDEAHNNEITTGYTPTVAAGQTSGTATLYVVLVDVDNTGITTVTVENKTPTIAGNNKDHITLTQTTEFNSADFKFGSDVGGVKQNVTITVKAKAGQKIALSLTGYTGSTNSAVGLDVAATNATTTDKTTIEFSAASKNGSEETGTIKYAVTATGDVTFVLTRNPGKTTRLETIVIEIVEANEDFTTGVETKPEVPTVTAPDYATLNAQSNKIYGSDFAEAGTVGVHSGTYGTAGIYTDIEGAVLMADGVVKHKEGVVNSENKGINSNIVVDFGTVPAGSTLEGYMELSASDFGSAWNLIQFKNASGATVFVIGTDANKALAYNVGTGLTHKETDPNNADKQINVNDTTTEVVTGVTLSANTVYKIYFKFDLSNGNITLNINGVNKTIEGSSVNDLAGIIIPSSNSGKRLVTIDNVVFCAGAVEQA